jgi:REP element-mobilizing transposase RayT
MQAQQTLTFRTHGGKRPGAGRPPRGPRSSEKHKARPVVDPRHPLHIIIRARPGLRLRRRAGWHAVRHALALTARRPDFRICHISVQATHIHLIVEADSHITLARGMQGFQVACARRFNLRSARRGKVFADRYHPIALPSPKQVHHALGYVLNNWRRHREDRTSPHATFDPYASARAFDGWAAAQSRADLEAISVVMPTTWHLTVGWRHHGPISPHARPGPLDDRHARTAVPRADRRAVRVGARVRTAR